MPVLGYETHQNRIRLTQAFNDANAGEANRTRSPSNMTAEEAQVFAYATERNMRPVHGRRTLDRFGYGMLSSTETRDRDQVSYRWGRRMRRGRGTAGDRPIIMVDQLWLWMFHDGNLTFYNLY